MEMRSRLTGMPNVRPTVLALVVVCVAAGSTAWSPTVAQPGREPALTKAQWREDLREFARELPKRHKNVYHATSREQFERAVADLDAAIPSLQDHQIIVKLQQIAATVGDGHTGVRIPPSFRIYPLALYWFGRELRVIAAGPAYPAALGARLVGIGGVAIDEVLARVRTCFPSAENENAAAGPFRHRPAPERRRRFLRRAQASHRAAETAAGAQSKGPPVRHRRPPDVLGGDGERDRFQEGDQRDYRR